jgi:hypothetical protein
MARWLEVKGKSGRGAPANKALEGPGEDKGAGLAGVAFASDEAAELAAGAGLSAKHFAGVQQSGVSGYTVADVRALLPED